MTTDDQKQIMLDAVDIASSKWKAAFNRGDAAGCAAQYESSAVMQAKPFGTFYGTSEIHTFWQQLIDDGFANVKYVNSQVKIIDETSAVLTSDWIMNKASGVIYRELWVLQADGTAKLREDNFEATK